MTHDPNNEDCYRNQQICEDLHRNAFECTCELTAADRLAEIRARHEAETIKFKYTLTADNLPKGSFQQWAQDLHADRDELLSMLDDLTAELEQVKTERDDLLSQVKLIESVRDAEREQVKSYLSGIAEKRDHYRKRSRDASQLAAIYRAELEQAKAENKRYKLQGSDGDE